MALHGQGANCQPSGLSEILDKRKLNAIVSREAMRRIKFGSSRPCFWISLEISPLRILLQFGRSKVSAPRLVAIGGGHLDLLRRPPPQGDSSRDRGLRKPWNWPLVLNLVRIKLIAVIGQGGRAQFSVMKGGHWDWQRSSWKPF